MAQCPSAYVDFTSEKPLSELAHALSARLFGGVPFIGKEEGIWDEVPAVRLAQSILGLEIVLGGTPGQQGGYALQAEAPDFPWEEIPRDEQNAANVDISQYLAFRLSAIPGIQLKQPEVDPKIRTTS